MSTTPNSSTSPITFIQGEPPITSARATNEPKNPIHRYYTHIYNSLISNLDTWAKVNALNLEFTVEPNQHQMSVRFPPGIIEKLDRLILINQTQAENGRRLSRNRMIRKLIEDAIESSHSPIAHQTYETPIDVNSLIITRQQKTNLIGTLRKRCEKDGFKLNTMSVFNDNTKGYEIWIKISRT